MIPVKEKHPRNIFINIHRKCSKSSDQNDFSTPEIFSKTFLENVTNHQLRYDFTKRTP